jgi:hypothetical protein
MNGQGMRKNLELQPAETHSASGGILKASSKPY